MGNIPLPALAVRPPEQPDMMGNMSKLMMLKNALGQQQIQQQTIQENSMGIQQKQREMQDQEAIMQAAAAHGGSLVDALPELAGKISARSFVPLQKSIMDAQKAYSDKKKVDLENEVTTGNQLLGLIQQAKTLPPDQYQQAFPQIAAQALKIKPELQGHIDPAKPVPQSALDQFALGVATHTQLASMETEKRAQAEEARKAALAPSQLAESQAAATLKQNQAANGGGVPVEEREMNDYLKKNPRATPSDFLVWKAQHSPSVIVQGGMGGPGGDPMVDMVGQGRVDLATATQRMAPVAKLAFMKSLDAKYPGYQQSTYGIEKKVGEEFTSGDAAKNLTAFNTAIEHASQLKDAANALDNGDIRGLNKVGNALGYQFGSDKTTNFGVIKSALSGEISKVFKGGQATDAEIREVQGPFDSANSPAQLKGAIDNAIKLMNSKRDALKQQYEAGKKAQPNFGSQQSDKHSDPLGIR